MLHNEMRFMRLKSWDFSDNKTVISTHAGGYKFTSTRLIRYWLAVDSAIHFWDTNKANDTNRNNNKSHKRWYKKKQT